MGKGEGYYKTLQRQRYGQEGLAYFQQSAQLAKFLLRKKTASERTAEAYRSRLHTFAYYIMTHYENTPLDSFITAMKAGKHDPYDVLAEFAADIKKTEKANQVRVKVSTSRKFLKFCGVKIDSEDFREQVTLPRKEKPVFDGVEKTQIQELLNACKNQRLKTALMLDAVMGCRASEGCSVPLSNLNLESNPPTITFPAEYSKMREARTRYMTRELAEQIKLWLKIKYAPHYVTDKNGKRTFVEPERKPTDLLLAKWHKGNKNPKVKVLYNKILKEYHELARIVGVKRKRTDRRDITFHSFRRFAKSTISDLGHADYSEWWIGHSGSTYYRKSERERIEIFRKIEPYLTFLDVSQLEAWSADQQTQLDKMQEELQKEREERAKLYAQLYKAGVIKKE